MANQTVTIKYFQLKVFQGLKAGKETEYEASSSNENWQQHTRLRLPGFDSFISLNLESFWCTALQNQLQQHEDIVRGLETVSKLGQQLQLKETFYVTLSISYEN